MFFEALKLPVKHMMSALMEEPERDPFSPDGPLSKMEPVMRPHSFPRRSDSTELRKVRIGETTVLLPVPASYERGGRLQAIFREPKDPGRDPLKIMFRASVVNDLQFDPPEELFQKHALARLKMLAIRRELQQLGSLPKFDLLVRILSTQADGFGRDVPLPTRVANLNLYPLKGMFALTDWTYYEDAKLRALVSAPFEGWSKDTSTPESSRVYSTFVQAEFAFRDRDEVFEVVYKAPGRKSPRVRTQLVLQFLADCALAPGK
ncbi:MAG: hypothetical protein ACYS9X_04260 [Planctomycetota bacterium]